MSVSWGRGRWRGAKGLETYSCVLQGTLRTTMRVVEEVNGMDSEIADAVRGSSTAGFDELLSLEADLEETRGGGGRRKSLLWCTRVDAREGERRGGGRGLGGQR